MPDTSSVRRSKTADPERDHARGRLWVALGVIAFLFVLGAVLFILESAENQRHQGRIRSEILHRISAIRAKIEGDLNGEILLTRSLLTELASRPNISQKQFEAIVADFLLVSKHIRNIAFARGTVISVIAPLEPNKAAVGVDYRNLPDQWPTVEKAILTKGTVVAGPVALIQGGHAIINRTPVFQRASAPGIEQPFLGILSSVIRIDTLIIQSGIEADASFLRCALRGKDSLGAQGDPIHGDAAIFRQSPLLLDIQLPNGTWQLGAIPTAGWNQPSPNTSWLRLGAGLLAFVVIAIAVIQRVAFERRRDAARQSAATQRRIRLIVEAAGVFWWEEDRFENTFVIDPLWCTSLLRHTSSKFAPRNGTDFRRLIHPEDYQTLQDSIAEHLVKKSDYFQCDLRFALADGSWHWIFWKGKVVDADEAGNPLRLMGVCMDLSERKRLEEERTRLIEELQGALSQVRTLSGLLPICSSCKKIRDDRGYWNKIETYLSRHSSLAFSHGICPDCAKKLYPEYHDDL